MKIVDVTKRVKSFRNANYKVWGRSYQGKKDLISRIEMSKVVKYAELDKTFICLVNITNLENLDISDRSMNNSILILKRIKKL